MDLTRFDSELENLLKEPLPLQGITPTVLLYGSSTFTHWGHQKSLKDLAPYRVINRAFGGSTSADALYQFSRLVKPLHYDLIALYEGDNDQVMHFTPTDVKNNYTQLIHKIRDANPTCKIVIVGVKPSPSRHELDSLRRQINTNLRALANLFPATIYCDVDGIILDGNGTPLRDLFLEDMLHLNLDGYARLAKTMKEAFAKVLG